MQLDYENCCIYLLLYCHLFTQTPVFSVALQLRDDTIVDIPSKLLGKLQYIAASPYCS